MTTIEANKKYALLVYDIPSSSKLRNPSMLLRRFAQRINLSCWVLPLSNVALLPLKEWTENGATVEVVEFDEHERDKVVALARRAIEREMDEQRVFVDELVEKVRKRYAAVAQMATGSKERQDAQAAAENYAYAALHRAKAIADAAEESAFHFDLTGEVAALVNAVRDSIKAKSTLFYNLKVDARMTSELQLAGIVPTVEAV